MRVSEADILFVPGLGGSGPGHWQHRWAEKFSSGRTVDLPEPDHPAFNAWSRAISEAIAACRKPVVMIGHSLGSLAIVHAVQDMQGAGQSNETNMPVRAAFLVTPPSSRVLETLDVIDPAFADIPAAPLPFPSLLIASRDDPYATMDEAESMALDWGSQIVDAGEAGHINADSGHGPWPEGLMRLATFMARLE
jgi:predicted alpha/beta hydrolase family esterase